MNRPNYKELWLYERKDRDEQLQWIRNAVNGNAKFCNSEPPYSEEEELARKIMQMHARIAELELGLNNQTVHSNTLQKILTEKLDRIAELEAECEQLRRGIHDMVLETGDTQKGGEMRVSEHANYLLNEYGRLQFDYAAYCKPYGESLRNEARNNLEEYIAELEAEQRWIPVSERLPEEDTDGNALIAICRYSGEWVRAPFGAEFVDEFVRHYSYWMYAPQPPEVQE